MLHFIQISPKIIIFRLNFIFLFFFFYKQSSAEEKKITILIDAGHGGSDPGALGKISAEKDLNLEIAKNFGEILSKRNSCYRIVYTREADVFVELIERSQKGRTIADIFISIHCNSCKNPEARGAETYVMSINQLEATSEAAKRENAVVLLEEKYKENYPTFDSNSTHSHILFELQNNASYTKSLELASIIQVHLEKLGLKNRGVKQDKFFLFYRILIPCVLVEVGYLSNVEEEKFLNNKENIKSIATALADAVDFFVSSYN